MNNVSQGGTLTAALINEIINLLNNHEARINNISLNPVALHGDPSRVGCVIGIRANAYGYYIPAGGSWFVYEPIDMFNYNCVGAGYAYLAGGQYWHGEHWEWGNRRNEYNPFCLAIRIA